VKSRNQWSALAILSLITSPLFAGPEHKNLRVLPKTITNAALKKTMDGFTEQLGVKCTFCHVPEQYEKDDRPHKADARRMIRLVLDLKAGKSAYFGPKMKESRINCGLCHRGKAEPEPFAPSLLAGMNFFAMPAAPTGHKNLKVLPKATSSDELKKTMSGFTEQLGVKCDFCHMPDKFEKDDKGSKVTGRRMLKMVLDMKAKKSAYFGPKVKDSTIDCGMCHRGKSGVPDFGS
jgi:hypothetical protein